jgi:hypothetical protein
MPRNEIDFHDGLLHVDKGDLEMASVKHHYPFSALMRQLSEFTCIKRAINIREVQRYCGRLEQDECLPRGWGFFILCLIFLHISVKIQQCPEV